MSGKEKINPLVTGFRQYNDPNNKSNNSAHKLDNKPSNSNEQKMKWKSEAKSSFENSKKGIELFLERIAQGTNDPKVEKGISDLHSRLGQEKDNSPNLKNFGEEVLKYFSNNF